MNIFLILGIIIGFGGVLFGYMEDGGVLSSLLKPSSASIVFGGSIGFMLIAFPFSYIKRVPAAFKLIFFRKKRNYNDAIDMLYSLATAARKDGLLAMESEAAKVDDPFIKKGLGYIADGVDPEFLKTVLEHAIEAQTEEYEQAAKVFEGVGGVAPAMGVLGTVMGMVSILREMGSDMEELGAKIATAFIATMYGVGSANLLWLPLGGQIKLVAEEEAAYLGLIEEGLLYILKGEYPSRMKDSLLAKAGEIEERKGKKSKS